MATKKGVKTTTKKTAKTVDLPVSIKGNFLNMLYKYHDLKKKASLFKEQEEAVKDVLRERFPAGDKYYRVKSKLHGELFIVHKEIDVSSLRATKDLVDFLKITNRSHFLDVKESNVVRITFPKSMNELDEEMDSILKATFEAYPQRNTEDLLQIYREAHNSGKKVEQQVNNMKKLIDQIFWASAETAGEKVSVVIDDIKLSGYSQQRISLAPEFYETYPEAKEMEEFSPFISTYKRVVFFVGTEQEMIAQQELAKMFAQEKEQKQMQMINKKEGDREQTIEQAVGGDCCGFELSF